MRSTAAAAFPPPHAQGGEWLNYGNQPAAAFERREVYEYERKLAIHRRSSLGSSNAGSSYAGASSSRLTLVKRDSEKLGPLVVKLEANADPPRRGVICPGDYLPPGQEDHLERAIMEEVDACRRRELEIKEIFVEQDVAASLAHASKEADPRVMKAEQAKVWIDLDSDKN